MKGHAEGAVKRYCELAKCQISDLTKYATPWIDDHAMSSEDCEQKGVLANVAARIVLENL
eukprot:648796-Karenia_brevis.AAC.1